MSFLSFQLSFSQHVSKNNYTGVWETPTSWIPTWAVPQTTNINNNITIYGLLTRNGNLIFPDNSADLTVYDTLVIKGNLTIGHNDHLTVSDNGILIVRGNLILDDDAIIDANGYLIVTGDIDKIGGTSHQYFRSNDNPVKVFIGGTIAAALLNKTWNPVLECTTEPSLPYLNSGCSYGNMTDIINDPIYAFFQSTCTLATPTITAGGPTTFCAGGSVNLTSSTGTTYLWSTGATTASINISASGSYTVRLSNAVGCLSPASAAVNVTVNALPVTPVITAAGPTVFCTGGSVSLSSSMGTSYLWSTGETTSSINTGFSGNFTVKVTNSSGCQSAPSVPAVVTVNSSPATPTISASGPVSFCEGGSVTLTSSSGTSYLWSTGATNGSINVTTPGSYTVSITNASGCQSALSLPATVTVNTLPMATAGNNSPVCAGKFLNLAGGPSGMSNYSWTGPNGFAAFVQNPTVSGSVVIEAAGMYSLVVTNAAGCKKTATTAVVINALPVVNITSSNSPMCINDMRTLKGSPEGGTFSISDGPGTISGGVYSSAAAGIVNLEYNYTDLCSNRVLQSIVVNEKPVAIAGPDQELSIVSETRMKAELSVGETGEWSIVTGSAKIINSHTPKTLVTELQFGDNTFQWKVSSGYCEASSIVKITIKELFIPSVITPDGDGKNDYFLISENIGRVELIIFNKWGIEEYSNANYKNDWNGRNRKGTELPSDTYFYVMKFENGIIKKGSVLIKR